MHDIPMQGEAAALGLVALEEVIPLVAPGNNQSYIHLCKFIYEQKTNSANIACMRARHTYGSLRG